jgi:Tol biopolymer transport system component
MFTIRTRSTLNSKTIVAALLALAAFVALAAAPARAADGPTRIVFVSGKDQRCRGDACNGFDVIRSVTPHGRGAKELALISSAFDTASTESGTVAVLSRNVAGGGSNSNTFTNVYLITPDGKRKAVFRKRIEGFNATGIGISGDGRLLVLAARYDETTEGRSKLFLVRADGSGFRQLTTGVGKDETPALSADGKRIAFARTIGDSPKPELYVMPTAGGEAVRLTENGLTDVNPVFSPDGRKIAFGQYNQRTHRGSIAVARADGRGVRTVTSTYGEYPEPDFSPNGRNLAYVAEIPKKRGLYESALYTVSASGGHRSLVTRAFEQPLGAQWTLRP